MRAFDRYELYIPTEQALHVYDRIVEEGGREEHGLVHAGLKALASLRMEKGYRDYGHDLDNTDTLLEAGLGFTADFDKPGGFIGMEAVQAQKAAVGGSVAKLPKRMIQVLLDDSTPFLHHGEVVYRNGEVVGDVRAGSFGHTVGGMHPSVHRAACLTHSLTHSLAQCSESARAHRFKVEAVPVRSRFSRRAVLARVRVHN